MNFFYLLPVYRSLFVDVNHQRKFLLSHINPIVKRYQQENDGTLDEEDFFKIMKYYGFGVPAIVGEAICTLHGRAMSHRERLCSTFQGALTGIFDDFFDKTGVGEKQILEMMIHPESYSAHTSLEKLSMELLQKVYENLDLREYFLQGCKNVFEAQKKSMYQKGDQIPNHDILETTFAKGGYSLLFYRSAFSFPVTKPEENALYRLGALMQLGNDIFDAWKDQRDGIRTPVTVASRIDPVREIFREKMQEAISACHDAGFKRENLSRFEKKFILAISRCFVCLDQLERLEKRSGGIFKPSEYSRKDMICDMEKPANILKAIKYFLANK